MNNMSDISSRQAALAAGVGLILMVFLAPVAYFSIIQNLIVPGDAPATTANIVESLDSFRMSIVMLLFVAILDILVAWGLYVLLKPINKSLSLLMAWIRVVYAAIYVVAIANLYNVLPLLSDAGYTALLGTDQINAQVMLLIDSFRNEWDTGLGIFGLHLFLLGYLVFKADQRILGILVVIAGAGYFIDSFGKMLSPDYSLTIGLYTFAGEILLIFWLIWIGFKGVPDTLKRGSIKKNHP
ncbi:MAG: DUF4386 domain-containing protein [Balneolaceae bacterium]|nr:DUF4386 domain-containing protein [Balneolaceae bacterium]